VLGAEILRPIEFLAPLVPMIRYHHTRYDGSGYPGGTGGQQLPLGARIIAVADAYQAMLSARPHRPAMTREQAIAEIDRGAGKQFDPKLAALAHELT
jgi:HD-GYP domain-containing protein (c-di-GMP phosphodiesterase class II)